MKRSFSHPFKRRRNRAANGRSKTQPRTLDRLSLEALRCELQIARELARDASHDIKNALNVQRMAMHLLKTRLERLPPAEAASMQESLEEAHEQSAFIESLVLELGSFSQPNSGARPSTRVTDSVTQALTILAGQVQRNCQIVCRLSSEQRLPLTPVKLLRVLVNLLHNALHSLGQKAFDGESPTIWIESEEGQECSRLRVRDNGVGIARENLERIFQRSFTTKAPGEGLGLGLSICRKLLEEAGGAISVEASPGEFAEFTLTFPGRPRSRKD